MAEINKNQSDTSTRFKTPQDELNAMSSAFLRNNVPPGSGNWVVPHAQQSIGLFSGGRYFYLNKDEALRVSRQDARNMLRNLDIRNPLEARMLAVAELPFSVEPQNKKDPVQVEIAKELQNIVEETPDFLKFKRQLMWAIWFGKSACQIKYRWDYTQGYKRLVVDKWDSVHGDSIAWHYNDDGVAILVGTTYPSAPGLKTVSTVPTDIAQAHLLDNGSEIEVMEDGRQIQRLTLSERQAFCIHTHNLDAADFFEPDLAQSVKGVGIRSVVWWTHYIVSEMRGWLSDYFERWGQGFTMYKFLRGDEQSFNAMKLLAESQSGQLCVFIPVDIDAGGKMIEGIERVEPTGTGVENFLKIIDTYYGAQIKEYIVGQQSTSANPGGSGLNSNLANVHEHTFMRLIKYDAINLQETLTKEFLNVIKRWTFPDAPGKYRVVLAVDKPDLKDYMQSVKDFVGLGGKIGEDAVRETLGLPKPDDDEVLLGQQQQQEQMGMGGDQEVDEVASALSGNWEDSTGPRGGKYEIDRQTGKKRHKKDDQ